MQSIQTMQTATFNQLALGNLTTARLSASLVTGGIVTFGLFVVMHALIDQGMIKAPPQEPFILISSILDIPEEKLIMRPTPKPIPEVKLQPLAHIELPQEPSNKTSFSEAIDIPALSAEKLLFEIGALDQQPRPLVRVDPRYPGPAATKGIEGFVRLSFGVSASGEVVDINIMAAEPRNTFDRAAKQALRKWRYQPKMVNGSPVAMEGLQVRLDFSLSSN